MSATAGLSQTETRSQELQPSFLRGCQEPNYHSGDTAGVRAVQAVPVTRAVSGHSRLCSVQSGASGQACGWFPWGPAFPEMVPPHSPCPSYKELGRILRGDSETWKLEATSLPTIVQVSAVILLS